MTEKLLKIAIFIPINYFFLHCRTFRETKSLFSNVFLQNNIFDLYLQLFLSINIFLQDKGALIKMFAKRLKKQINNYSLK